MISNILQRKVAIYLRVSTEDQAREGYSLEVQRECLEAFAGKESHQVFKIYSDDGISGYSAERPALKELFNDAKAKKFELAIVYKIDRFSRNLRDLLNLVDELSSYGVGFKSATELFDKLQKVTELLN
jgi:site-specific DNA recombinase